MSISSKNLDLRPLEDTCFFGLRSGYPKNSCSKTVYKYVICFENSSDLSSVIQAVKKLLQANPFLCATFPQEPEDELKKLIEKKPNLTINGEALCLSKNCSAPLRVPSECTDKYFSKCLLKEPVNCGNDHYLEKNRLFYWTQTKGNVCPAGHALPVIFDELLIDDGIKGSVSAWREELKRGKSDDKELRAIRDELSKIKTELKDVKSQLALNQKIVAGFQQTDPILLASYPSKVIIKLALPKVSKIALRTFSKSATKESSKAFGKTVATKGVPVISTILGVGFAIHRYQTIPNRDGKWIVEEDWKVGVELLSAAATLIPAWGAVASFAIDTALLGSDIYDAMPEDLSAEISVDDAKEYLGLENTELTRENICAAHRKVSRLLHPDKTLNDIVDDKEEHTNVIQKYLNACRDLLLEELDEQKAASKPRDVKFVENETKKDL